MAQKRKHIPGYVKNVARSFGYMAGDIFAENNPVIKSIFSGTKEATSDMYQSIKDFAFTKGSIDEKGIKGTVKSTIDDVWNNFKDDLKTGNWYNKERDQAASNDMAKALGLDFDLNFDDEDWGDFDNFDDSDTITASAEIQSAKAIVAGADATGERVANAISNATVESASYIVASNNRATKALYSLNERGFMSVNKGMVAINNSIASFAQLSKPLSEHMQNSALFYTKTTETLNTMNQSIQQLVKNTTPAPSATSGSSKRTKGTFDDVFDSDGVLDINSYKDMIKENFKDSKDLMDMAMNALKSMRSENGSYGKNFSVMKFGMKMFTNVMIPKMFKDSMKSFNDSLKYMISDSIMGLRNKSGGFVFELLKDFFLPKDGYKDKISTSNYNKGPVAWDGISRKALTEVIPTTLLKIYSAISGAPEMIYDYNKGKFVPVKAAKDHIEDQKRRYAQEAGGDFRDDALKKAQTDQLKKEIDNYFYNAFKKGEGFQNINKSNFDPKEFGLSNESLKILQKLVSDYRSSNDPKVRNRHREFGNNVYRQRNAYGNFINSEEASGTSIMNYLENGLIGEGGIGTDEFDHSISFYLRGIYEYTGFLADNISYIAGKSDEIKIIDRNKKGKDPERISSGTTSSAGERTRDQANTSNSDNNSETGGFTDPYAETEDERRIREEQERKNKAKGKIRKAIDNIFGFVKRDENNPLYKAYSSPANAVAGFLNKLGNSFDRLIWGDDNDPEKGVFGWLFDEIKEKFNQFDKWFDKTFGTSFSKIKDKFTQSSFAKETKESLKKAGKWVGKTVNSALGVLDDDEAFNNGTAAHGRKVTKTGIVAVSEGEMIVPAELNPYYHGVVNKNRQIANETRAINNFYGAFSKGGNIPVTGEVRRIRRGKGFQYQQWDGSGWVNLSKEEGKRLYIKQVKANHIKSGNGVLGKIYQGGSNFVNGAGKVVSGIFNPEGKEKKDSDETKIIKKITVKILEEAGEKKGALGAGALIGAGLSVVTGSVVGPLFGAAIGSAVGLVASSESVQKLLFGATKGPDGEYQIDGGLFNKHVSEFMMKNVPSMAKGGTLGAISGLFLGSPIIGAVVGAAGGFVASSENARKTIFGSAGENEEWEEGIIPKKLQDSIKKAAPNMAAGAIGGLLLGPFGSILPNMIFGAGLGYITTSEKFHNYMFGDGKDDKGLTGLLKEKIFDNLDTIFHNMGNAIKGWGKSLIKGTTERLKDFFTSKARAYENGEAMGPLGKLIGGTLSLGGRAVKGTVKGVGGVLGGIANRTTKHNLRKGYGVYDRTKKRNMFASERIEARGNTNGTFGALDDLLRNAKTPEELDQLISTLEDVQDPKRMLKRTKNNISKELYEALKDLDPNKADKVVDIVNANKPNALSKIKSILTEEEFTSHEAAIMKALSDIASSKNTKSSQDAIIKQFKDKGINISKQGNLLNAIDQAKYEKTNGRFSPEELQAKEEKDWRERTKDALISIDKNLAEYFGKPDATGKIPSSDNGEKPKSGEFRKSVSGRWQRYNGKRWVWAKPEEAEAWEAEQAEKAGIEANNGHKATGIQNILDSMNDNKYDSEKKKTEFTEDGPVQYIKNSQNEWIEDEQDSDTKKTLERRQIRLDAQKALGGATTELSGIKGMFSKFSERLLGKKDEDGKRKGGILGSLFSLFSGDSELGILERFAAWMGGTAVGSIAKSILSKFTFGNIITNLLGPGLFAAAFTGHFNSLGKKLTNGNFDNGGNGKVNAETGAVLTSNGDGTYTDPSTGQKVDEHGNVLDEFGEKTGKVIKLGIQKAGSGSVSEKLQYNTARGILTGTRSVASVVFGKTALGKGAKSVSGLIKGAIEAGGDDFAGLALQSDIREGLVKFFAKLKSVPMLKNIDFDGLAKRLSTKAANALTSNGARKVAEFAKNAVFWAKIAFVVIDFTTGFEDAATTLKVKNPTTGEKVVAGLLRAIKNFIPIIGTLIPDSLLVDIFVEYVAPIFGMNVEEFKAQRAEAEEELNAYNEKNGTDMSWSEYNKQVRKDYTWTERLGNATKSTWEDTKNKFSNMTSGIKEKGLGGYLKDSISGMTSDFMSAYNDMGGGVGGILSGIGSIFQNMLPGVIGEIAQKNTQISALAVQGKFKEMWEISLDDFSQMNSGEGVETAVPGIFSRIIGQVPLITTKIIQTPIAALCWVGHKLGDSISPIIDKIKNSSFGKSIKSGLDGIKNNITSEDFSYGDYLTLKDKEDDPENPMSGIFRTLTTTTRLLNLPALLLSRVGYKIGHNFSSIVEKTKNGFSNFVSGTKDAINTSVGYITSEDFSYGDYLSGKDQKDDQENPLHGFMKVATITTRYFNLPKLFLARTGYKLGKVSLNIAKKVVNSVTTLRNQKSYVDTIVNGGGETGNISDLFDMSKFEDPENPIGGFMKTAIMAERIHYLPTALLKKAGIWAWNGIKDIAGKVKDGAVNIFKIQKQDLTEYITTPEKGLTDLFTIENVDDNNPIGGFSKAAIYGQRIAATPILLLAKGGYILYDWIKNIAGKVKDGAVNIFESEKQNLTKYITNPKAEITDLLTIENADNSNPLGGFSKLLIYTGRFLSLPVIQLAKSGYNIYDWMKNITGKFEDNQNKVSTASEEMKTLASDGSLQSLLKVALYKNPVEENGPLSKLNSIFFKINKIFYTIAASFNAIAEPISNLFGGIGDKFDKLGDWAGDKLDNVKEAGKNIGDKISSGIDSAANWAGDNLNDAWKKVTGKSGGSSGFVSQYDPRYQGYSVSGTSFANKGCGPAVASMAASAMGKHLSVKDAVKASRGYQNASGVTLDYFTNALGGKGINTRIISGGSSGDLYNSIASGNKVVLLGRDPYNTSKENSPFGPNNHYVLATGLDRSGNVIVNDPENNGPRAYSPNILNSTSYGISGGDSGVTNDIPSKVWGFFTSKGYSPAATAGIMGNLQQESGMNPERFQDGGPAAGIAQWENYKNKGGRWATLNEYAHSLGYEWSDLDPQLAFIDKELTGLNSYFGKSKNVEGYDIPSTTFDEFKNSSDPQMAAMQFEKAFERAGKPRMSSRLESAKTFYNQFSGSQYTGSYTPQSSSYTGSTSDSTSSSTESSSGKSGGIAGILSTISSAFSDAFGKIFGTSSSSTTNNTENTSTTDASSEYSLSSDSNTTFSAVNGVTGPGNDKQKALANKLIGIEGKIDYSMSGARNPDKGSADCSSTVNWAYKQVTGTDIGNNTNDILLNNNTEIIDLANLDQSTGGKNSKGPNINKLMPGDIMLYSRPDSGYSSGRPFRVGHVEMYMGNGKRIGHPGPGAGPRIGDATDDSNRYIMAKRLKGIADKKISINSAYDAQQYYGTSAAGSGLPRINSYNDFISGGSSGLLLDARPGSRLRSRAMIGIPKMSGGASGNLMESTTEMLNNVKTSLQSKVSQGGSVADSAKKLLDTLVKILETIANNTGSIQKIYEVLSAYTSNQGTKIQPSSSSLDSSLMNSNETPDIDSNIIDLVGTLAAIAKG